MKCPNCMEDAVPVELDFDSIGQTTKCPRCDAEFVVAYESWNEEHRWLWLEKKA